MSPGARAGAGSVGGRMKSEDLVQTTRRFRDRSFSQVRQLVRQMRGIASPSEPAGKSGLPTAHLRGFNGLEVAASEDALAFIPPPRGISPSRRVRFQNLFFFPGFTPSIRRANPRSRCLEDAPGHRVGQPLEGLVIHFQPFCRWTRVDNFRFDREIRNLSPIAFGQ